MYIGNAMYGNYAAVFAQLIIDGRSQGLLPTQTTRIILFISTIYWRKPISQSCFYLVSNSVLTLSPNMHEEIYHYILTLYALMCGAQL